MHLYMTNLIKKSSIILVIFYLTGCIATTKTISDGTELKPDEGLVILRLVANAGSSALQTSGYNSMNVQKVDISNPASGNVEEFSIGRSQAGSLRSSVFFGNLPEGTYKIIKLNGDRFYVELKDRFPLFTVSAGKASYLGTIVHQQLFTSQLGIGPGLVSYAVDPRIDDLQMIMRSEYPKLNQTLAHTSEGWSGGFKNTTKLIPVDNIIAHAAAINKPVQSSEGTIYAGSVLGQVIKRDKQGNWSQLNTGSIHELISVSPVNENTILVGGDAGVFMKSNDRGHTWNHLPKLPVRGTIFFIGKDSHGGYYSCIRRDNFAYVYKSSDPEKGNWELLQKFETSQGWNIQWSSTEASLVDDKLVIVLPPSTIHVLDIKTNQWKEGKPPFSWSSNMRIQSGGFMYATGTSAILTSLYISNDYGITWKELDTSTRSGTPAFIDTTTGFMTHTKIISIFAGQFERLIQRTTDGGATWEEMSKIENKDYSEMLVFGKNSPLFLISPNGEVSSSTDQGATWKIERKVTSVFK